MNARRVPWEVLGAAVAATVGLVDALVGRSPDLAVIFATVIVLTLLTAGRSLASRRRVQLRADVFAWLEQTALAEGSSVEEVADSALSAARAGIAAPGSARR